MIFQSFIFLLPDLFVFMWKAKSICPSSGAFWVKNVLHKKNYIVSLADSGYSSYHEINHALALASRKGQASLHVWESKLATFVLPQTKKVGVGDCQTASEVGAASEEVGVRFTQSLQMTRLKRDAETIWKDKTPSGCYYSDRKECHTLRLLFFSGVYRSGSSAGGPLKSFSKLQTNYLNSTVANQCEFNVKTT